MLRRTRHSIIASLGLMCSCSTRAAPELGEERSRIYSSGDGHATEDVGAHPQVFTIGSPGGNCTAALVASDHVLTAGHCVGTGSGPAQVFVKSTGTFTANVQFNAPPSLAVQLPSSWTTTDTDVLTHPLYQNYDSDSVDVAILRMPTSIPRCAMKPLKVVNAVPSPPITPRDAGSPNAWQGIIVRILGGGNTNQMCTSGFGTSIRSLVTIMGGVVQSATIPHQGIFFMPWDQNASHACTGDSGGPVVSTDLDSVYGTNIPKDQIVSIISKGVLSGFGNTVGPYLQSNDIRTWLVDEALDRDNDGFEAPEDNCDTIPNMTQADSDGDGIGDPCDAVAGVDDCADKDGDALPNHMDPCMNNPDNTDSDGDGLIDCADPCPEDETNTDPDSDGVCGDADNCPNDDNAEQANCNLDAELAAMTTPVGDVCDPVPCVRSAQASETTGSPSVLEFTVTTRFDVEPIRAGTGSFDGTWGHRFCECDNANGSPTAPGICAQSHDCDIGPNVDFDPDGPDWRHTDVGIDDPPATNASFSHPFAEPAELQPGGEPATLERMVWDASPGNPLLNWSVKGAHWFHVKTATCLDSPCPPSPVSAATLDELASHHWAGEAGQYLSATPFSNFEKVLEWWLFPEGAPGCAFCGALEVLPFVHVRPDDQLAIRTPAGDYLIESTMTTAAAGALKSATGVRWIAPSEMGQQLSSAVVKMASVSTDGAAAGPAIVSSGGGFDLHEPSYAQPSPPSRDRFGTVLRASHGDLVVIGGISGGNPTGDVWKYDIQHDAWQEIDTDRRIVPGPVLAVAYQPGGDQLLVLDEIGAGTTLQARLWSLKLAGGATRLLGSWSRVGIHDELAMSHALGNDWVLLAKHASSDTLDVVRFRVNGGATSLVRLGSSTGSPIVAPRTNHRGIHVVVDRAGTGIQAARLDWTSLEAPGSQTLGDFVR